MTRSLPLLELRAVRLSPNPTILPPVVVVVLNHASSENVCGPPCQYGDAAWTVDVLDVPGKPTAASGSLSSAPGWLRTAVELSVRSSDPAWS